jgi:hypothetical protein
MKLEWLVVFVPLFSVIAITLAVREHAAKAVRQPTAAAAAQAVR